MTDAQSPKAADVLSLTTLLGRHSQATTEVLIKLVEYQVGAAEFPGDVLHKLASQLTWVGDTIRHAVAEASGERGRHSRRSDDSRP